MAVAVEKPKMSSRDFLAWDATSFVRELKAARTLSAQQLDDQARLSAALAPFRVKLADYRFDREDANARR